MTSLQILGFDWHLISYPQQLEHLWIPSLFIFYVLRLLVFFFCYWHFFNLPFSVKLGWKFPLAASSSPLNCVWERQLGLCEHVWTVHRLCLRHTHTLFLSHALSVCVCVCILIVCIWDTLLIGMPCIYVNTDMLSWPHDMWARQCKCCYV